MLIETFIRKQLRLKAHTVTKVEETDDCMLVHLNRLGKRLLRCGVCRHRCRQVHDVRKQREWRDLSMRKLPLKLLYRPRRVECPRCGVRVEDFPWAQPWARVTTALANAVAVLARVELAGHGARVRIELEKCSHHCETSGSLRAAASGTAAGARDRDRRGEPTQGAGLYDCGLRSGTTPGTVGGR